MSLWRMSNVSDPKKPYKPTPLFVECICCGGTKKTRTTFNRGAKDELPEGSPCFACCADGGKGEPRGFVEYGVTDGQVQAIIAQRDGLLIAATELVKSGGLPVPCDGPTDTPAHKVHCLVASLARYVEGARQRLNGRVDIHRRAYPPEPLKEAAPKMGANAS